MFYNSSKQIAFLDLSHVAEANALQTLLTLTGILFFPTLIVVLFALPLLFTNDDGLSNLQYFLYNITDKQSILEF